MLWAWTWLASIGLMAVVWAFSVPRKDTSLVDRFWGVAFVVVAGLAWWLGDSSRPWLLALVTLWAARLSWHITRRNWGRPEDARYTAMRNDHPRTWAWRSLLTVFTFQATLAWIVALPVWWSLAYRGDEAILFDIVGGVVVVAAIALETLADSQLRRLHVSGTVMDKGLWRYSRHPNYFFEAMVWWGFWIIAVGHGAWWTVVSPLLMTALLRFVSTPILEKTMGDRPGWADYVRRTNMFFPWFRG